MTKYAITWFIVVEHKEELNKPRQLDCLEHLSDEAKLTEVNDKPEKKQVVIFDLLLYKTIKLTSFAYPQSSRGQSAS